MWVFEAFRWNISSSINLSYLKSVLAFVTKVLIIDRYLCNEILDKCYKLTIHYYSIYILIEWKSMKVSKLLRVISFFFEDYSHQSTTVMENPSVWIHAFLILDLGIFGLVNINGRAISHPFKLNGITFSSCSLVQSIHLTKESWGRIMCNWLSDWKCFGTK